MLENLKARCQKILGSFTPTKGVWLIKIVISLAVLVFIGLIIANFFIPQGFLNVLFSIISCAYAAGVVAITVWLHWNGISTVKLAARTTLVRQDSGEFVRVLQESVTLWSWDKSLRNTIALRRYGSFQGEYEKMFVTGSIQVITENPKVIKLTYQLVVTLGKESADLVAFYHFLLTHMSGSHDGALAPRDAEEWFEYQRYEFNNRHGKDLSKLYNPVDDQQQRTFNKLIRGFFEPLLKNSGLVIAKASFAIES